MKIEFLDWSILRLPLIIFTTVCLVAVSIVSVSHYYRQEMEREFDRYQADFRSISSQYLHVDEEEMLIREYYPEFIGLYKEGLIGKERRLDWIESLQAISEILEIPSLRYEISSQAPLTAHLPIDSGRFNIYQSVMKINLDMLHEVDLVRFLDRINKAAQGFYSVSSCNLTRKNRDIDLQSEQANVAAECNLNWYSIRTADGDEIVL